MTAETLKPFLANTNLAKSTTNGYEKSTTFFKNHKNVMILSLTFFMLIFCVAISTLQVDKRKFIIFSIVYKKKIIKIQ